MMTIHLSAADIEALRSWRFRHPDPRVQVRLEALSLRSQRVAKADIRRRCGMSQASVHHDRKADVTGGIAPLQPIAQARPQSQLAPYRSTLEASCRDQPPATVVEASAKITELTGMARQPTPVRQFWHALGMKPRHVGMLPAKADVDAPEAVKKPVWSPGSRKPRRANARSCSWRPRMGCLPPFGGWSGAFNACWAGLHLGGNACMSWPP